MLPLTLLVVFLFTGTECAKWTYSGEHGPDSWAKIEDAQCGKSSQSPIDIVTDDVTVEYFEDLKLEGYSLDDEDAGQPVSVLNTGHGLNVNLEGGYYLSGGGLPYKYQAVQFHFHWGSVNTQGSEHTMDRGSYSAEMHIVHYNSDKYNEISAAFDADDYSVAVLGVFIEVGEDDNEALKDVFTMAMDVPYEDDSSLVSDNNSTISLFDILPKDLTRFFRYNGSLTTPACNEVVVWTVFEETIQISQGQMDALRELHEGHENEHDDSKNIEDNYRPVQPLNKRVVYFSSASSCCLSTLLSALCVGVLALRFTSELFI